MSISREFSEWAVPVKLHDLPPRIIRRTALQFVNMASASAASMAVKEPARLHDVYSGSGGPCTVVASGRRTTAENALLANSSLSMALDFDDYLFAGHTGHSSVFSAIAAGEEAGASPSEILCAVAVANELGGRVGASVALGPQNGQMWTHIHAGCAAAAAGRILGLDADRMANALGIAYYQPPFALARGFMGFDSKMLSASMPALAGLAAARLAAAGLSGPADIFEHRRGFGARFASAFLPSMLSGFGRSWVAETLSYKIYPGCAYLDAAVDAVISVLDGFRASRGRALQPRDVDKVVVRATAPTWGMERLSGYLPGREYVPSLANFSAVLSVCTAIIAGGLGPEQFTREFHGRNEAEVRMLASKTELQIDWKATERLVEGIIEKLPAAGMAYEAGLPGLVKSLTEAMDVFGTPPLPPPAALLSIPRLAAKALSGGRARGIAETDFSTITFPFSAEVELRTVDGRNYEAAQVEPIGTCGRGVEEQARVVLEKADRFPFTLPAGLEAFLREKINSSSS